MSSDVRAKPVLIFDLDGTLYDPWRVLNRGLFAAAAVLASKTGIPADRIQQALLRVYEDPVGVFKKQLGFAPHYEIHHPDVLRLATREAKIQTSEETLAAAKEAYQQVEKQELKRQGVLAKRVLAALSRTHRLVVFTRGKQEVQRAKVRMLGLSGIVPSSHVLVSPTKTAEDFEKVLACVLVNPQDPAAESLRMTSDRQKRILSAFAGFTSEEFARKTGRAKIAHAFVVIGDRQKSEVEPVRELEIPTIYTIRIKSGRYAYRERTSTADKTVSTLKQAADHAKKLRYLQRSFSRERPARARRLSRIPNRQA